MIRLTVVNRRNDTADVLLDGEVILTRNRQPLLDGARVCLDRGLSGPLCTVDASGTVLMTGTVEGCAKLTVAERNASGIRFEQWKADPRSAGVPKTAENDFSDAG